MGSFPFGETHDYEWSCITVLPQSGSNVMHLRKALMQSCYKIIPFPNASRALLETEQGYAQTDRALREVVFGMERFHQHAYGNLV